MDLAARQLVKWRLLVAGLVVIATGQCGWAGEVKPSAEPRFGVEGERHRMVLPLSAVPRHAPSVRTVGSTVDVTVIGLQAARSTHQPNILSASARGIRGLVVRNGTVSVRGTSEITQARAFVLRDPPRLVVDVHLDTGVSRASAAGPSSAGTAGTSAAVQPGHGEPRIPAAKGASSRLASSGKTRQPRAAVGRTSPRNSAPPAARPTGRGAAGKHAVGPGAGTAGERSLRHVGAATAAQPEAVTPVALPEGSSGSEVVQIQTAPLVSEAGPAVGDEMPGRRYRLEMVNGKPMIWPDLAAPMYRRAGRPMAAARFLKSRRRAIDRLRQPEPGPGRAVAPAADRLRSEERRFPRALPTNAPAAAHFLEADLEYLRAAVGRGDFFRAIALYGRALRIAPEFRDRDRGRLMMGLARLTMGLAMEAEATFVRLAGETEDPWAASLAYLGAARAGRVAGGTARAIQLLRRAIASERRSEGACRARGDLGIVLVESGEAKDGLVLFDEMRSLCPAEIVRAPEMTFSYVGLLAAAGHLEEAEDLLMTLPDYDGDAFVQRKFLEADLANATGTPDLARQAYEAVRASNHSPPRIRAEATMRLARVEDRAGNHDRADTLLRQLADESAVVGVRAKALATAAELLARRHRYADGLRILAQTDVLGPAGFAAAERVRSWLFRSWIDELAERGDEAGIVAVYYRWRGDGIGRHLGVDEMVRVASAAVAAGLPELAVRVLSAVQGRVRGPTRIRARRILAEAALAAGESAEALRLTEEIVRTAGNGAPRRDVALVRAHALVHLGRVEEGSALLQAVGGRENLIGVGSAYLRSGMEPRRAYEILNTALAGMENGSESERSRVILDGWLALADAAGAAGEKERAAAALQTAIRLFPEEQLAGARYRVASFESSDGDPATAARRLAAAAQTERDPLFARLAAAEAAYYRALDHAEVRR